MILNGGYVLISFMSTKEEKTKMTKEGNFTFGSQFEIKAYFNTRLLVSLRVVLYTKLD